MVSDLQGLGIFILLIGIGYILTCLIHFDVQRLITGIGYAIASAYLIRPRRPPRETYHK